MADIKIIDVINKLKGYFAEYDLDDKTKEECVSTLCVKKEIIHNPEKVERALALFKEMKLFENKNIMHRLPKTLHSIDYARFFDLYEALNENGVNTTMWFNKCSSAFIRGDGKVVRQVAKEAEENGFDKTWILSRCSALSVKGAQGLSFADFKAIMEGVDADPNVVLHKSVTSILNSKEHIEKVLDVLKSLEEKNIVRTNAYVEYEASVFSITDHKEIIRLVDYLENIGVNPRMVISKSPNVLHTSLYENYANAFSYLKERGFSELDIAKVIKTNPSLLKNVTKQSTETIYESLSEIYGANAKYVVLTNPKLLDADNIYATRVIPALTKIYGSEEIAKAKFVEIPKLSDIHKYDQAVEVFNALKVSDKYKDDEGKLIADFEKHADKFTLINLENLKSLDPSAIKKTSKVKSKQVVSKPITKPKEIYKQLSGVLVDNKRRLLPNVTVKVTGKENKVTKKQGDLVADLIEASNCGDKEVFNALIVSYIASTKTTAKECIESLAKTEKGKDAITEYISEHTSDGMDRE